ncbi:hypothetical protein SNOG_05344 [Parastagonospora nodorum SN15]|uniref:Uncharacterized protein n=1 Tax=Phaeosphaeria nodorum (strain SN15 / ATCC MYA-4574 / FGSC 10173) TaxID=321614 RepID=Q0USC0_PHANO|nr:hypothetical protein SNOG_05344 [Parastagonospora nodorum SN15]EAT87735.1 hypothetical protein SNOG_05344 [Parastagonospora nodorum SN15]
MTCGICVLAFYSLPRLHAVHKTLLVASSSSAKLYEDGYRSPYSLESSIRTTKLLHSVVKSPRAMHSDISTSHQA